MDKTATEWMIEPLRRYAQFSGRARRAEFWWFFLFCILVSLVTSIIDKVLGTVRTSGIGGTGLIGTLASLGLVIPQLAVAVRRFHDIDRTGWWVALPLALAAPIGVLSYLAIARGGGTPLAMGIVAIGLFAVLVLMLVWQCTRGTDGPNRFGPDPLTTPPTD